MSDNIHRTELERISTQLLSPDTAKYRTRMLLFSTLLYSAANFDLIPREITFLGLTSEEFDSRSYFIILFTLSIYYTIYFYFAYRADMIQHSIYRALLRMDPLREKILSYKAEVTKLSEVIETSTESRLRDANNDDNEDGLKKTYRQRIEGINDEIDEALEKLEVGTSEGLDISVNTLTAVHVYFPTLISCSLILLSALQYIVRSGPFFGAEPLPL